jgi:RNA polymerase sigma factor (sigma-70 family)
MVEKNQKPLLRTPTSPLIEQPSLRRSATWPGSFDKASDGELLKAVRQGHTIAYGHLFERHWSMAVRVAKRKTPDKHLAEDAVHEAFASILSAIRNGAGPIEVFRPYLLASVSRAIYKLNGLSMRETPMESSELARISDEYPRTDESDYFNENVYVAFTSLPTRWQKVIWHMDVEEMPPRQSAPLLGLSPNAAVALHRRAKKGLKYAYHRRLKQHQPALVQPSCSSDTPSSGTPS